MGLIESKSCYRTVVIYDLDFRGTGTQLHTQGQYQLALLVDLELRAKISSRIVSTNCRDMVAEPLKVRLIGVE